MSADTLAHIEHFFANEPQAQLAIVFGSAARGALRAGSDIDVGVWAKAELNAAQKIHWIEALALLTGRAIDLIDLRTAGQPLLGEILQGKVVKRDSHLLVQLTLKNLIDRQDFLPLVERTLRERRERWLAA